MQTRTWPNGTVKQVTVFKFSRCHHKGMRCTVLAVVEGDSLPSAILPAAGRFEDDQKREAYILVMGPNEPERQPGTRGTITFTPGGPTGGYWKFTPQNGS